MGGFWGLALCVKKGVLALYILYPFARSISYCRYRCLSSFIFKHLFSSGVFFGEGAEWGEEVFDLLFSSPGRGNSILRHILGNTLT